MQINQNGIKYTPIAVQGGIRTKIALQSHKTRNNPLNAKSKTREVSIKALKLTKSKNNESNKSKLPKKGIFF